MIGLDDTDHPDVGCTTHALDSLVSRISDEPWSEILERRLVRLWPFASRRTRGNGALSVIVSVESGSIPDLEKICTGWFDDLSEAISDYPKNGIQASPCLLISYTKTPESWYWESVRGEVDIENRRDEIRSSGVKVLELGEGWGIIGASAAISWAPEAHSSWELIAWRDDEKVGSERIVSHEAVTEMTQSHPKTFLNRDPTKDKGLIAPRTPCPVLYGIRGETCKSVTAAHMWMQERDDVETSHSWAPHRTNQMSDDHLIGVNKGTVLSLPEEGRGAHASISVLSNGRASSLVVFKEGGEVNRLVRQLIPGDRINWMGLESPDGSIHLERVSLLSAVPRISSRPSCCGKTMRSAGKNQSLRCLNCGNTSDKIWLSKPWSPSGVSSVSGWFEPSPSQRRHLAKPLSQGVPT
tara:strand:- start:3313 stop:4542 length:1230 start_codon:yes stop_codon:yes gene_type:complete